MKRRTFLRNAAAGGLAVAVAPAVTSSADNKSAGSTAKLQEISTERAPKRSGRFPRPSRPTDSSSSRGKWRAIRRRTR